ncbi:MAG: ATP-binding cassette domain-containing protein [Bacteroidota bacterium]
MVLDGLNLNIALNSIHGILGPNGAGKTTFFKLLSGVMNPIAGSITYHDRPIEKENIAFLETSNYFYPFMKGKEYLQLLNKQNKDLSQWNELFELPLEDLIENYSTGMKKKLAFLGVLLLDKPILILDEPFNGVDIESNEKLFHIIQSLAQHGKTIIISSHILSSLTGICHQISRLEEGKVERTYELDTFEELGERMRVKARNAVEGRMDGLFS